MAESGKNSTAAIIGAIATLITAIGGLIAVLNQTGVINLSGKENEKPQLEVAKNDSSDNEAETELASEEPPTPSVNPSPSAKEEELLARIKKLEKNYAKKENKLSSSEKNETLDQTLMEVASEVNKFCPFMVDQETRLDNAMALPNNTFQYNYTLVNTDKAGADLSYINNYLNTYLVNMVKTSPDLEFFRENSVTIIYSYKDMFGSFLTSVKITPDMYRN